MMSLNVPFLVAPDPGPPIAAPPEARLAEAMRRDAERLVRAGRLGPARRRALVRDYGIALAALAGLAPGQLAEDHHLHAKNGPEICRRLLRDAGIAGASDAQG